MAAAEAEKYEPMLRKKYYDEIVGNLMKQFGYKNVMQAPRVVKVSLNMGLGEAVQNVKILDGAVEELTRIAGQKAIITKARRSIATFKLRQGMPIGCTVTLRRERMWEFLERFIALALPRVRDFKGVSPKGFDGRGNYTVGVKEQVIFPEIDYDKVEQFKGLNVTIVTSARTDEEGRALLKELGMPFRK
jgi:large subunit ribosomal protein L5